MNRPPDETLRTPDPGDARPEAPFDALQDSPVKAACDQAARWLVEARRAVVLTGAGISTESGIPDFRSPGGVWANSRPVLYQQFLEDADARYEYWRQKSLAHREFALARPNAGHLVLARWEAAGRIVGLLTQNIDELHQQAGSRRLLELHGTARRVLCLDCDARFDAAPLVEQFLRDDATPACPHCGGRLKHATISFGQMLEPTVIQTAFAWSRTADLFLVVGSSLVVEPAAELPRRAKQCGARLVIINRDPGPLDDRADLVLHQEIGPTLVEIDRGVERRSIERQATDRQPGDQRS